MSDGKAGVAQLFQLFGDMPKDSPAGKAVSMFLGMLVMDAKHGGAVGSAFKAAIEALRNSGDPIYAKMPPTDAMAVMQVINALKGHIDG